MKISIPRKNLPPIKSLVMEIQITLSIKCFEAECSTLFYNTVVGFTLKQFLQ